jgi:hypothetical protein
MLPILLIRTSKQKMRTTMMKQVLHWRDFISAIIYCNMVLLDCVHECKRKIIPPTVCYIRHFKHLFWSAISYFFWSEMSNKKNWS